MNDISLDDRYQLETGHAFMTAAQSFVRIAIEQRRRDVDNGFNTAGFVSGYRGSPLGTVDMEFTRAKAFLAQAHIRFNPGVNEELAATSMYGTQQLLQFQGARYEGVFGIWYGKGPGVDRAGDALKHGNLAGAAALGGVLVLAGDDHAAKSSTVAHQSEYALQAAFIPVVYPSTVQEYLDYGLLSIAMSRFSGSWVAMKCVTDTADSSAVISVGGSRTQPVIPSDFALPPDRLNYRAGDRPLVQEERLVSHRLPAVQAFARANRLDRVTVDGPRRDLGIISAGKTYLDVMHALGTLGLDETSAPALGIRVYKLGLIWPLVPESLLNFATGHREILVVEEKRPFVETQVRDALYDLPDNVRPRVTGKRAHDGAALLPSHGEMDPTVIARAIHQRLCHLGIQSPNDPPLPVAANLPAPLTTALRFPYFCSGCPHNTSTRVPSGSLAMGGIGCHAIASAIPGRSTTWPVQMGGEGANWIGIAPFTNTKHVFQNLGDGTYFHSGILAVRAAVAANVAITYKILYNDAVAMTGGQALDGTLTVPQLARQLLDEGVGKVVVVADNPSKYSPDVSWPPGVAIRPRDQLDGVQQELREIEGVTAIVYDQVCAAEKRRRGKRAVNVPLPNRVVINEQVCEGCGDCGTKSNCVSLQPSDTEFGVKRRIDQSSCNKDYSCVKGFCPSFVTVSGGVLKGSAAAPRYSIPELPAPATAPARTSTSIMIVGIGGTGVVTLGAILAVAAHIDGLGASITDQTGLSQKNGPVTSHVRISKALEQSLPGRIARGEADVLIACDIVAAAGADVMHTLKPSTAAVLNDHEVATAAFTWNPSARISMSALVARLLDQMSRETTFVVDAYRLATTVLGDAMGANVFLLGAALQKGLLPLSVDAVEGAIRLNGAAVEMNLKALNLGRWAVVDPVAVGALSNNRPVRELERAAPKSLDDFIARRAEFLEAYQDRKYAKRYRNLTTEVRAAECRVIGAEGELSRRVAGGYFKLMAYKDEYEVARLYSEPAFRRQLAAQFERFDALTFHLAPPGLTRSDPATGEPKKIALGGWMLPAFGVLAKLKWLRGTAFDPFGRSGDRVLERALLVEYEETVRLVARALNAANLEVAVQLAGLPDEVRGYGHVKRASVAAMRKRKELLLSTLEVRPEQSGQPREMHPS
jgi:indolepyruvate ferredoxin oxidoreductase